MMPDLKLKFSVAVTYILCTSHPIMLIIQVSKIREPSPWRNQEKNIISQLEPASIFQKLSHHVLRLHVLCAGVSWKKAEFHRGPISEQQLFSISRHIASHCKASWESTIPVCDMHCSARLISLPNQSHSVRRLFDVLIQAIYCKKI